MDKTGSFTDNAARATMIVIFFTVISKVLGMLRESIIAGAFGASGQTDAFNMALAIPSIFLGVVYGAITTTFIPTYTSFMENKTKEQGQYFINNIFNMVVLISVALTALGMVFAPTLVRMMAPGFEGETFTLTVRLTGILFLPLIFLALSNLANGYLQAHGRFAVPAGMSIPHNILVIGCIVLFYRYGITAAAVGCIIGTFSQFLIQVPGMIKAGYRFMPVVDYREEGLRRMAGLVPPVLISCIFNEVYIIIDRILASGLREGSISAMEYANKVNSLVYYVFIVSLATVAYPALSMIAGDAARFTAAVAKVVKTVIIISLPMTVGLLQLRVQVINVLFERGQFTSRATSITSIVLGCFSVGIMGVGLREVLNRAFYSLNDTKTPMVNGIIAIGLNIVLDVLMVRVWGVAGLASATSIAALVSSGMLLLGLRRKVGGIRGGEIAACFAKALSASMGMGLILLFMNKGYVLLGLASASTIARMAGLGLEILTGGLAYIVMLYALKIDEVKYAVTLLQSKVRCCLAACRH